MDASSTTPSRPVTRLACNRCHQQKLRCHRSLIPGQPCARCANARVQCIFEPPLRPGRPSTRRKSHSKGMSPSECVTASSLTQSGHQEQSPSANNMPREYLSEVDRLSNVVASECPMASNNHDQASLSPFPELGRDEPVLFVGCRSPLYSGQLCTAPDWIDLSSSNSHSSSFSHEESIQRALADEMTNPFGTTASSSLPPSSSSFVSAPSLLGAVNANFYRLSELSMTLEEYHCQLLAINGAQSDSVVDPPLTIDQILAVTQSLAEILSPVSNHTDPNDERAKMEFPLHAAYRSLPDSATALLILSCYLRVLHLFNAVLSSPSAVAVTPISAMRNGDGNGNGMQPLHFQIGCFSTPMTSSMSLLACVISQLLGNLEALLECLASSMNPSKAPWTRFDQAWPSEPDAGPVSSVMAIARAAMLEMKSLQANLHHRLQLLSSASYP
ncbi:transcription factor ACEII [Aspergillus udagawae]|uniref:Transcription factor ACEII n=1 Tax=Aspergillus udagawae TaxID=91492 RepID=A0A8H3S5K0_9EURO|nr:transcription factor ACEII [Aspergillus udagawae]